MACSVTRNNEGIITEVLASNNKRSVLFDEINSNLYLPDSLTALDIYMNSHAKKVKELIDKEALEIDSNNEPKLFYQDSQNQLFDNMEELLITGNIGKISIGFLNNSKEEFIPVAKLDTSSGEKSAFVTDQVQQGLLAATKVQREDGRMVYQGKGEFDTTRIATATMVSEKVKTELGTMDIKIGPNGQIDFEVTRGYVNVIDEDGTVKVVKTINIPEAITETTSNKAELMLQYVTEHADPIPLTKATTSNKVVETQEDLTNSLHMFLESLGFTTSTLEKYSQNYNSKYGKDPDIRALVDMANKVVAFQEGEIRIEDLSEEVAHIAIEAYSDQNSIASALINAHLTDEYKEHAEYYRNKYSDRYEGVELEDQVRKEILGKVLSKEFMSRFKQETVSEERAYLLGALRNIWNSFVEYISNIFKPHHKRALEALNKRIADSVFNNEATQFENDLTQGGILFSATNQRVETMDKELQASKRFIEDLFRKALNQPVPNQAELDKLGESIYAVDTLSEVSYVVAIAENQISVLKSNLNETLSNGEIMTKQDSSRYNILKNNLVPSIEAMKLELDKIVKKEKDPRLKTTADAITKAINKVVVELSEVSPLVNKGLTSQADALVEKVVETFSLDDKTAEEVRSNAEGGIRDTGYAGFKWGLASHSKNILIQLLHQELIKITSAINRKFNSTYNNVITYVQDKGLLPYQKDIVNTDEKGNATYYFLSPKDEHWYDTELEKKQNEEIARLTGKTIEEVAKLREQFSPKEIIKDDKKSEEYAEKVKEWKDTVGIEKRFSTVYYKQRDERFDKANVSKETRKYLENKNIARFTRAAKYMNKEDGSIDRSRMSEAERTEDRNDFKNHVKIKSAFNTNGDVKIGLKRVKFSDLTEEEVKSMPIEIDADYTGDVTILDGRIPLEELPIESRRALDLFNLDMLYRKENKDKIRENTPIEQFNKTIEDIEAEGKNAFDWVKYNASVNLTSEYYEGIGIGKTYEQIAEEYFSSLEAEEASSKRAILKDLQETQRVRKEILKQNRKADSILETDVHHMVTQVRERLLELEDEIAQKKRALDIPFEMFEENFSESASEVMLNSDFNRMLTESGKTAFEFSLNHMSNRNKIKVQDFAEQVDDFIIGRRSHIKPHFDRFISEQLSTGGYSNLNKQEIIQKLKDEYAKRNIAKYFLRNEPKGYTDLMNALENKELSVSEFLNNKQEVISRFPAAQFVEIIPEYSWSDDVSNKEFLNPNFKAGVQGRQVKKLNEKFFDFFGVSKEEYLSLEDDDLSKLTPTKNKEAYELLKIVTNLRQQAIDNNGDTGRISKFLRVQLSKGNFEKVLNLHKGTASNIKDFFTDFSMSKKDEKEYGEELEDSGIGIKTIPKYYQTKLESADILTDNILHAAMLDLKASIRFDERFKAEGNVRALEQKLLNQKFTNSGGNGIRARILKKGEVSNYYSKFQEMADHGLYGVRESRKMIINMLGKDIDVTQMFAKFTKYISNLNLGYNIIADATSYATGVYNNAVDAIVGDYYHKSSVTRATRDLPMMIAKYVAETGAVQKESELSHWMEFFNVQDAEDKLNQSSSGRLVRMLSKSAFGASKLANLGVTPKNMITLLHDYKYYNGKFQSSREFERNLRIENSAIKKSEVNARWNQLSDSLYDNLVVDPKKGILPGQNFKEKFGEENYEEKLNDIQVTLTNKLTQINQSIDGVISASDQTAAQRDVITNALMLHRGWFIINLTRKFKGRHFNIATGQIDSGHYSNVFSILSKGIKKGLKKDYELMIEDHERRNFKRMYVDTAGVILITVLLNAMLEGDDDDDTEVENFAQLIAMRLVGETQSQGILGIVGTGVDIYQNPIVQTSTLKNFSDAWKAYDQGNDEKLQESLLKNILPAKRYFQYSDLEAQLNNYRYHNSETLIGVTGVMEK